MVITSQFYQYGTYGEAEEVLEDIYPDIRLVELVGPGQLNLGIFDVVKLSTLKTDFLKVSITQWLQHLMMPLKVLVNHR